MAYDYEIDERGYFQIRLEPGRVAEWRVWGHSSEASVHFNPGQLGNYLRHLREKVPERRPIRTVASATSLSTGYISKIETGDVKGPPGLRVLRKLADYYSVGLDTLLVISGAERPEAKPATDDSLVFFRMLTHEALRPRGLRKEDLLWLAPQVQRHWLDFARRLLLAERCDEVDLDALLGAGEDSP